LVSSKTLPSCRVLEQGHDGHRRLVILLVLYVVGHISHEYFAARPTTKLPEMDAWICPMYTSNYASPKGPPCRDWSRSARTIKKWRDPRPSLGRSKRLASPLSAKPPASARRSLPGRSTSPSKPSRTGRLRRSLLGPTSCPEWLRPSASASRTSSARGQSTPFGSLPLSARCSGRSTKFGSCHASNNARSSRRSKRSSSSTNARQADDRVCRCPLPPLRYAQPAAGTDSGELDHVLTVSVELGVGRHRLALPQLSGELASCSVSAPNVARCAAQPARAPRSRTGLLTATHPRPGSAVHGRLDGAVGVGWRGERADPGA
jgi:hypothetical protein